MKAFVLTRFGPPENLQLREIERTEPGDLQVLVQVHATAVNDWDWTLVRGRPLAYRPLLGLLRPKVTIPGAEIAGIVEAVGPGVTRFRPGDAVHGDISEAGFGGFAEYACVHEDALFAMPAGMPFTDAAALPHAALLALQGLELGGIRDGQRILINGAGGGVGTLGVQLARQWKVEVTGVDAAEKLGMMRELGFDHVIDYRERDFAEGTERYDLILDAKSTRSPLRCLRALAPGGTYVTVGGETGRLIQILTLGALLPSRGDRRLRLLALRPNEGLERVDALYEAGRLRCVLDGPFPFAEIPERLRAFGEARHLGKVVIAVRGDGR